MSKLSILDRELKAGLLFSRTKEFQYFHNKLNEDLYNFFRLTKKPYLSLSWGKQSICLAHCVSMIKPGFPMLFLRSWESFLLHDFENIISKFRAKCYIDYREVYRDNVSWNDWDWKKTRDYGSNDIQEMADREYPEWDGVIMGLAQDESVARRITTNIRNTPFDNIFKYTNGKYRCCPLKKWEKRHLAAYIAKFELPILSQYHYEGLDSRTTARITKNNAEMNGMRALKHRNIGNYNEITKRFPELSAYT